MKRKTILKTKHQLRQAILDAKEDYRGFNKIYDYSSITDISYLLFGCTELKTIPILYTQNVTNMAYMFFNCISLECVHFSYTGNVENTTHMFYGCEFLKEIFNMDTKNVENFSYMFHNCKYIKEEFDFDFSSAKTIKNMYCKCNLIEYPICDFIKDDYVISEDEYKYVFRLKNIIERNNEPKNDEDDSWFMQDDE